MAGAMDEGAEERRRRETKAVKTELQKKRTKWGRGGRRGGGGGGGLCLLSAIGSGENIMQVRRDSHPDFPMNFGVSTVSDSSLREGPIVNCGEAKGRSPSLHGTSERVVWKQRDSRVGIAPAQEAGRHNTEGRGGGLHFYAF